MWHSVLGFPSPLKSARNSTVKSADPVVTSSTSLSTRLMSPSLTQALLRSNEHFWLCTTYTGSVNFNCQYLKVQNWPSTGIWVFPGPRRTWDVLVNSTSCSHWTSSPWTITGAPVTSLKRVVRPFTPICYHWFVLLLLPSSLCKRSCLQLKRLSIVYHDPNAFTKMLSSSNGARRMKPFKAGFVLTAFKASTLLKSSH